MSEQTWTVDSVRKLAQFAVSVEIYTLPFYLTALASIKDTSHPAYTNILSVCMEEMLHLELVANLCLAIGTVPNFTAPNYDKPVPLDPNDPETGDHGLIKATLGSLNQTTLNTMLDIETPEEFEEPASSILPPYSSIGQMYKALWQGIKYIGWDNLYVGNTTNQQSMFTTSFSQTISSFKEAHVAIHTINEQGEGKAMNPVPQQPFTIEQFPIPEKNQLTTDENDPGALHKYAHYGRFIDIQHIVNIYGFPDVYPVIVSNPLSPAQQEALEKLQTDFTTFITNLNELWTGNGGNMNSMYGLLGEATNCWVAGVIPKWSQY